MFLSLIAACRQQHLLEYAKWRPLSNELLSLMTPPLQQGAISSNGTVCKGGGDTADVSCERKSSLGSVFPGSSKYGITA